jgi:hypothetical protein
MGGFWPRIYLVKKGHAREIYFLLQTQTRTFWHFSAPSSLFTCCYLLASAFHKLPSAVLGGSLTSSFDPVALPI